MPSPFPGMDPWVEQHWESFHGWFIRELARQMLPKARALGCWIDVERSVYQKDHSGGVSLLGAPDDTVWLKYDGPNEWDSGGGTALQVAVAEPKAIHEVVLNDVDSERMKQDYLVVREMGRRRPVLAMIELLSPANKSGSYAPKYQEKRLKMLSVSAHFMEIDFLRSGDNPSRDLFPELEASPYFIFVARKTATGRQEAGYPLLLQNPLPTIGLPIGPPRPDLPLDLQAAFDSAYDLSVPPGYMPYDLPPIPAIDEKEASWASALIRQVQEK